MEHQDEYISILIAHEAPPLRLQPCGCGSGDNAIFICNNCHGAVMRCHRCILAMHRWMPLHRMKRWNGKYMEEVSLSTLGLITFFGHGGLACPMATPEQGLTVLHIDGLHTLTIAYCGCDTSLPHHLQIFDSKLFSASIDWPRSAFTFEVLRQYQIHHLEGKGSAHTHIHSLYRLTNDKGFGEIMVCLVTSVANISHS
jgi:hypothetical protein